MSSKVTSVLKKVKSPSTLAVRRNIRRSTLSSKKTYFKDNLPLIDKRISGSLSSLSSLSDSDLNFQEIGTEEKVGLPDLKNSPSTTPTVKQLISLNDNSETKLRNRSKITNCAEDIYYKLKESANSHFNKYLQLLNNAALVEDKKPINNSKEKLVLENDILDNDSKHGKLSGGPLLSGTLLLKKLYNNSFKGFSNKQNKNEKNLNNLEIRNKVDSCNSSLSSLDVSNPENVGNLSDSDASLKKKVVSQNPEESTLTYNRFLGSLSPDVILDECEPSAKMFRTDFGANKGKLVEKLFQLYNEKIFDNAIPKNTPIEWSNSLRKTGANCNYYIRKYSNGELRRFVKIQLSVKVLDEAYRLRDTLLHEMCHAASYLINKVIEHHGPIFKAWGEKAKQIFPNLPPVTTHHSYKINTKYTYKCLNCGHCYNRHSKSIDISKKCCGKCRGRFQLFVNKVIKGEKKTVPVITKPPSQFAVFVKNNYATYKDPQLKHGDVMKLLGEKFNQLKVSAPKQNIA